MPVTVVCCPDKLKHVLTAGEAADALARGVEAAGHLAVRFPIADGGEGTAEAFARRFGGCWMTVDTLDALGRPVVARFLLLDDGRAVVDSAEAIGLWRLRPEERDPLRATSRGLGVLLAEIAAAGAHEILVGLGGSATVDGGAGMREVVRALPLPVTVISDVTSPLLGPNGAARLFGPQKGASPAHVDELEQRLAADRVLAPYATIPGAGAAGGLGAAFLALGARLRPGFEFVAAETGLGAAAASADVVVTGEGAVDASSLAGKAAAGVVDLCMRVGTPCIVFGGLVEPEAAHVLVERGAHAVVPLSGDGHCAIVDLEALGRMIPAIAGDGSRDPA